MRCHRPTHHSAVLVPHTPGCELGRGMCLAGRTKHIPSGYWLCSPSFPSMWPDVHVDMFLHECDHLGCILCVGRATEYGRMGVLSDSSYAIPSRMCSISAFFCIFLTFSWQNDFFFCRFADGETAFLACCRWRNGFLAVLPKNNFETNGPLMGGNNVVSQQNGPPRTTSTGHPGACIRGCPARCQHQHGPEPPESCSRCTGC